MIFRLIIILITIKINEDYFSSVTVVISVTLGNKMSILLPVCMHIHVIVCNRLCVGVFAYVLIISLVLYTVI